MGSQPRGYSAPFFLPSAPLLMPMRSIRTPVNSGWDSRICHSPFQITVPKTGRLPPMCESDGSGRWPISITRLPFNPLPTNWRTPRSEEHTSELQSHSDLVCRLLLEKKKENDCVMTVCDLLSM